MARHSEQFSDTDQLVTRKMRSIGPKRIFIVIGVVCILIVIGLFVMLENIRYGNDEKSPNIRHTRSIKAPNGLSFKSSRIVHENMRKQSHFNDENVQHEQLRLKRHMIPNDNEHGESKPRYKRLSEYLQQVKSQFERCRSSKGDQSECAKFYREMITVSEALNHELQTISDITRNIDQSNQMNFHPFENHGKIGELPNTVGHPLHELNRESKVQQNTDEFTTFPKFHEDLDDRQFHAWKIKETLRNNPNFPIPPPMTRTRLDSSISIARDNEKIVPLKNPNFDPSGQILSLCDQINRQSTRSEAAQVTNLPGPTSSGFVTNNPQSHNFNQNFQSSFQSVQQQVQQPPQPISQPPQFAQPPVFYRQNPVCYFPQSVPQQIPLSQSLIVPPSFVAPVPTSNAANRFVLVNGNTQQFGTTSPSGQGFIQVGSRSTARSEDAPVNDTYYCPYSNPELVPQSPLKSSPTPKSSEDSDDSVDPFASFISRLASINITNPFNVCRDGETSCANSIQCISNDKWCDNVKDCEDASDETSCSCPARLNDDKLCDGYLDCPLGTDEVGCFGCNRHSYSCFNNFDEYQKFKSSSGVLCYTLSQKCDGITDCITGKDEEECSMLIKQVGLHTTFMVPYSEGILYRNFRGRWYPVCENGIEWAIEACQSEMGDITELPLIKPEMGTLPGPFIFKTSTDQIRFSNTCPVNTQKPNQIYIQAKCPELKCGVTQTRSFMAPRLRIRDDNDRRKRDEHLRIVGGDRSGPHSWPYVVAIYKNGRFHCGGTIYTNQWIISAAHCVSKAQKQYYEVYAGMLRRFSYAPEVQISKVVKVIVNEGYDRDAMMNDVSLLRLESPLLFNRWVKPICMPSPERVTSKLDTNWMFGPSPGTVCTVIGWGALAEGGSSPDNLEEVKVPIMKSCKEISDINGNEICAGYAEGGLDACQGDSGGPLVCKSASDPNETYLAGIVSHGEGCARKNEPGVYTRVALYVDWINEMINSDLSITAITTQSICPGFVCVWSSRCISQRHRCNGEIDCLGGEDELQCTYNPVGVARKRYGRQNANHPELPNANSTNISQIKREISPAITESSTLVNKNIESATLSIESSTHSIQPTTVEPILKPIEQNIQETATNVPIATTIEPNAKPIDQIIKETTTIISNLEPSTSHAIHGIASASDLGPSPLDSFDGPTKATDRRNSSLNINEFSPTVIPDELIVPVKNETQKIFHCRDIAQKINHASRCDGRIDCEDGTDEKNCTCRETLYKKHTHLICNGIIECLDGTDEEGCLNCLNDQFACPHSNKCIPKSSRCNKHVDCRSHEDELDCFALTDGKVVLIDLDSRPKLLNRGIVCENINGVWSVKCISREDEHKVKEIIGEVCFSLGFSGYSFHNLTRTDENGEIVTKPPSIERHSFYSDFRSSLWNSKDLNSRRLLKRSIPSNDSISPINDNARFEEIVGASEQCVAVFLECIPHSVLPIIETKPSITPLIDVNPDNLKPIDHRDKPMNHIEELFTTEIPEDLNVPKLTKDFHAPWLGSVLIDGSLQCIGVLLDRQWVIVDNTCVKDVDLNQNAVIVVMGKTQNLLNVKAPFKKIHRVNCVKMLKMGTGTLLFLPNEVDYDRYTLPTYIPPRIDDDDKDCIAVTHDETGGFTSIPVYRNDTDCPNEDKNCYQTDELLDNIQCNGFDAADSGVVACRDRKNSTYYPISLFSFQYGLCSFSNLTQLEILEPAYNQLQTLISWPICSPTKATIKCNGHRCPLGECLSLDRVCDKIYDCHDGSDEDAKLCKMNEKCASDELRCDNGECIPKSKYCDGHVDCHNAFEIEKSDEPSNCTCHHYLTLADPSKICNGIIDCFDRTDEHNCAVTCHSFDGGNTCIQPGSIEFDNNFYHVTERSTNEWETICLDKFKIPTKDDLHSLCTEFGYNNTTKNLFKLIESNGNSVIATNVITTIKLNDKFTLTLFDTRDNVNEIDRINDKICSQLAINCGP